MFAKLISIEGPDRVGKATQSKNIVETFKGMNRSTKRIEIPFNDRLTYKMIYWMLRNGLVKKTPNLFQFVQFFNKFLFQIVVLPWLWLRYDFIVFDRWALSAIVYGDASGASGWFNRMLCSMLVKPYLTIILMGRARGVCDEDVYEKDTTIQKLVRVGYNDYAAKNMADCCIVDCEDTVEAVHWNIIEELIFENIIPTVTARYP